MAWQLAAKLFDHLLLSRFPGAGALLWQSPSTSGEAPAPCISPWLSRSGSVWAGSVSSAVFMDGIEFVRAAFADKHCYPEANPFRILDCIQASIQRTMKTVGQQDGLSDATSEECIVARDPYSMRSHGATRSGICRSDRTFATGAFVVPWRRRRHLLRPVRWAARPSQFQARRQNAVHGHESSVAAPGALALPAHRPAPQLEGCRGRP